MVSWEEKIFNENSFPTCGHTQHYLGNSCYPWKGPFYKETLYIYIVRENERQLPEKSHRNSYFITWWQNVVFWVS
jgi:hypothetical protein